MPRKETTCPDCRGYGYLHMLGRRHSDKEELVACDCRDGRRFLRLWREELAKLSPPAKLKSGEVDAEGHANADIREQVEPYE
tara:strand:+ start:399 stop:644 length:246 start_codon:yes stop_codon:yes gene_type:complete